MNIQIRKLTLADEKLLNQVAEGVFDDPIQPASARMFLSDPRHHLVVAVEDQTVVGFATAVHYEHPDKRYPEMWVNEVGVAPTHRGHGLARRIITLLFEVAAQLGCREAWVLTDEENAPAMGLYASLGGLKAPNTQIMYSFILDRSNLKEFNR